MPQQDSKVSVQDTTRDKRSSHNTSTSNVLSTTATSPATALTFYPAYTYALSPTWFTWIKLTCHTIHHDLHPSASSHAATTTYAHHDSSAQYPPPLLLFYLNHPIQFIQVVGVIVSIEPHFEKFWLFTVDDSSGATLDITCQKPVLAQQPNNGGTVALINQRVANFTSTSNNNKDHHNVDEDPDFAQCTTLIPTLDIGSVVQAKGTLTTFRSTRQLHLRRLVLVPSTTHELRLIRARTRTYETILSRPWVVSPGAQMRMLKEARGEDLRTNQQHKAMAERKKARKKKKVEREERHDKAIAHEWAREEQMRRAEAERIRGIANALE